MKIKQEFWELIKQGKKNIELRKVSKLKKLLQPYPNDEDNYCPISNGKFDIDLYFNSYSNSYLGTITINGYEIIKKEQYNKWFDLTADYLYENEYYDFYLKKDNGIHHHDLFKELIEEDITIPYWFINNFEWIYENNKWIDDYFKDEKEILVLKIESWEE